MAIISPDLFAMQNQIPEQDTFNAFFLFSCPMMKFYHTEYLQITSHRI